MERIETIPVFARACDKHLANVSPGTLVDCLVDIDIVICPGFIKRAIRRKTHSPGSQPGYFPALIPFTNRNLVPESKKSGLVILVEVVDVKTTVVVLDFTSTFVAPMLS